MRRGSEAAVGSSSLWRHCRFRTSSAKPRKIMQQMARSAPIRATNWGRLGQVTAQPYSHFTIAFKNSSFCSFLSPFLPNPNNPNSRVAPSPSQTTAPTNPLTSWWGKALHCSSTKQFRKGKGMKQKRMIRKTAPLITPWDSGLCPSSKEVWRGKRKGGVVTH